MAWISSGVVQDPKVGEVLLDSGALPAGAFTMPLLLMSSESDRLLRLEWRNAANAGNRQNHTFIVRQNAIVDLSGKQVTVAQGDRLRVVTVDLVEGAVQVSALT
jgi:hypothetical protein